MGFSFPVMFAALAAALVVFFLVFSAGMFLRERFCDPGLCQSRAARFFRVVFYTLLTLALIVCVIEPVAELILAYVLTFAMGFDAGKPAKADGRQR